jgi:RNA polymerase sigma-70 factor (ECF subfamily)
VTFDPWESLLEAARVGADWAWADLYSSYAPRVRGYALSQGAADPDDLVGEVFLQAVRNLPGFTGTSEGFRSWLFTIAHRRILDARRRASRRPEQLNGRVPDVPMGPTADEAATNRLLDPRLEEGLALLTVEQRQVIALRVIADLSVEDVARILNKRTGAVKALQHRGLRQLRRHLAEAVSR